MPQVASSATSALRAALEMTPDRLLGAMRSDLVVLGLSPAERLTWLLVVDLMRRRGGAIGSGLTTVPLSAVAASIHVDVADLEPAILELQRVGLIVKDVTFGWTMGSVRPQASSAMPPGLSARRGQSKRQAGGKLLPGLGASAARAKRKAGQAGLTEATTAGLQGVGG